LWKVILAKVQPTSSIPFLGYVAAFQLVGVKRMRDQWAFQFFNPSHGRKLCGSTRPGYDEKPPAKSVVKQHFS
jgi:hypothetical protein